MSSLIILIPLRQQWVEIALWKLLSVNCINKQIFWIKCTKNYFHNIIKFKMTKRYIKNCDRKLWTIFLFKFVSIKEMCFEYIIRKFWFKRNNFFYINAVSFLSNFIRNSKIIFFNTHLALQKLEKTFLKLKCLLLLFMIKQIWSKSGICTFLLYYKSYIENL